MVLGIFIGGMFLGFSLGIGTMALLAARGPRFQDEEGHPIASGLACAYSPVRTLRPRLGAGARTSRVCVTPGP